MGTAPKPLGKAMYVATRPDWDWLWIVQRNQYTRREQEVDYALCKLWGFVHDPRNLRMALARVAGNRGRRTAGVGDIAVGRDDPEDRHTREVSPPGDPTVKYRLASARRPLFAIHHGEPGA